MLAKLFGAERMSAVKPAIERSSKSESAPNNGFGAARAADIAALLPDQPFDAPWHAEVFALAVHLNEADYFCWQDWASRFGKNLAAASSAKAGGLNGGDDYYQIWLETLIALMQEKDIVDPEILTALELQWRDAYLATPHGESVHLKA